MFIFCRVITSENDGTGINSIIILVIHFHFRVARKVAGYLGDVLEDNRDKLQENLLANGSK